MAAPLPMKGMGRYKAPIAFVDRAAELLMWGSTLLPIGLLEAALHSLCRLC